MNGRNGTTSFLPVYSKIGGQGRNDKLSVGQFLTREQTNYIYKKTETGEMTNMDTIEQEMEQEEQLSKIDDTSGETNPYHELIVNNAEKVEPLMTQMEQWSILSNILNYVQHGKFHSIRHVLGKRAVNKYKHKLNAEGDREFRELDLGTMPLNLCKEYMDVYEGIQSEIVSTTTFDENSDLSTTYLGRIDKENKNKLRAEESFPIIGHGYTSVDCWMAQSVNCYWTGVHTSHSCNNHCTCIASHPTHCQNLPQRLNEYK